MRVASCVAVQLARRVSRGCAELVVEVEGDREERRVSGRPGAEGAPRSRSWLLLVVEVESFELDVLVVLVG
jgi:hypothetical protein